jgi:hypothetical protein
MIKVKSNLVRWTASRIAAIKNEAKTYSAMLFHGILTAKFVRMHACRRFNKEKLKAALKDRLNRIRNVPDLIEPQPGGACKGFSGSGI